VRNLATFTTTLDFESLSYRNGVRYRKLRFNYCAMCRPNWAICNKAACEPRLRRNQESLPPPVLFLFLFSFLYPVLYFQGLKISKCGKVCPEWLRPIIIATNFRGLVSLWLGLVYFTLKSKLLIIC